MSKKFTVVDTRTNRTKTFESTANTVGELKADLRREGIDPDGMAIQEGLTKTELGEDTSYLPHDVPYKGGTTDNLVFRLTQREKRIKSGSMSRSEAFAKIKELGLTDKIHEKYGRNFTQCTTDVLISEIEDATRPCCDCCNAEVSVKDVVDAVTALTQKLAEYDVIDMDDADEIIGLLGAEAAPASVYPADEIADMFKDMD